MKQRREYRVRKLIPGSELSTHSEVKKNRWYIAIPDRGFLETQIYAQHEDRIMLIEDWNSCLFSHIFQDRFSREKTYRLGYFEWAPTITRSQMTLGIV